MSVGSPFPSVITAKCEYCYERYEMSQRKADFRGYGYCSQDCLESYQRRYRVVVEEALGRP